MKNKKLLYFTLCLFVIGLFLYAVGTNVSGTWRESIVTAGLICLLSSLVSTLLLVLIHKLEAVEELD